MISKDIKKQCTLLQKLTERYFVGVYSTHLNIFDAIYEELEPSAFTPEMFSDLQKLLDIFFLGQIVGLPTLHSILAKYGLSNGKQIQYKKICNKLTINSLILTLLICKLSNHAVSISCSFSTAQNTDKGFLQNDYFF